ncbi:MAG: hypothetical protein K5641_06825 [Lachnospiraceae bacterium]|nr:hypothetical protein [Lachnospiraceae bacterium]
MLKQKIIRYALAALCALGVFAYITIYLTQVFTPGQDEGDWALGSTYAGFYAEPEASIDVLFLGSSYGAAAFSPNVLVETCGIRSYNLCCEQQSIFTSYYWLKEALRFQSPKVVVLDPMLLFPWDEGSPINSPEPFTRAAFDAMHWSSVKKDAVMDLCARDDSHELGSYLFPLRRYHDRWKELGESDFAPAPSYDDNGTRGYVALDAESGNTGYEPLYPEGVDQYTDPLPLMKEYLDRIATLCAERGIHLCLITTPSVAMNNGAFHALTEYAKNKGILYFDMNEYRYYAKIGYDFATDNAEDSHANVSGARKITGFVGELLQIVYGL